MPRIEIMMKLVAKLPRQFCFSLFFCLRSDLFAFSLLHHNRIKSTSHHCHTASNGILF